MNTSIHKKRNATLTGSPSSLAAPSPEITFIAVTLTFFALLLAFPDIARGSVMTSLTACFAKLIPSLFPFMVAGDLFFSLGAGEMIGKRLGKPFRKLFGISENGVSAFLLGAVCGLPLGAKYALSLYKSGSISRSDCERLMGISTNSGPGFVVAGIGLSLYGSVRLGWILYLCQIGASVISGILLRGRKGSVIIAPTTHKTRRKPLSVLITEAVSSSVINILKICGFVVFFGVLTEFIVSACAFLSLPALLTATLSAFTELTSACEILHVFSLSNTSLTLHSAHILTFFAVGFSGMCAHLQTASLTDGHSVSMRTYYLTKLLSGIICALLGASALHFLPSI